MKRYIWTVSLPLDLAPLRALKDFGRRNAYRLVAFALTLISVVAFFYYYQNGLGIAYNDARSHLDIGRRVIEGLKPGLAQLGSVWLPLPHILMVPLVWNDWMWHSGFAGALWSMIGFIATGLLIYKFLERLGVGIFGRMVGVAVFVANLNILYLQSSAMTELLLLGTMTAGCYTLLKWFQTDELRDLINAAFWIMMSTLVRYDGWFLLAVSTGLIVFWVLSRKGFTQAEGTFVLFCTLAGFGIFLWLLWNLLIFKDPLYFAFGPYSAYSQQTQLEHASVLPSKHDLVLSAKIYYYALAYNSGMFTLILGALGAIFLWFSKKLSRASKVATVALLAPLFFNILALYLGHSVLYVQGISGDTWFNVRYGLMMMPSLAIFIGFLVDRARNLRIVLVGCIAFVTVFAFTNADAVVIDDGRIGSSQKNVSEVSGYLAEHAKDVPGFILISAASHDAIIFSSGLPMKKFIHEGTGAYWTSATVTPDRWARWIVMRSNSVDDQTWRLVSQVPGFERYDKVRQYPFADIYELRPEWLEDLVTEPVLPKER
jgi:hypothetical protein